MSETAEPAAALLRDIATWCERGGRSESELGRMVLNHGGFVPLLRKRMTLSPATDRRIRQFMQRFPDGCEFAEGRAEGERMHALRAISAASPIGSNVPRPTMRRVRDDNCSVASQIEIEATRLGCSIEDMLGRLVAIGWDAYRERARS